MELIIDKTFDKNNFAESPLAKGEYEHCLFTNCDFSSADLSEVNFLECVFVSCNVSLAKLTNTAFRHIKFKDCKMLGLHFESCNKFGMTLSFDTCNLTHSSFYQTKIKGVVFKNTRLSEVDFTECDLANSVFENCDLTNAKFENTILEKADLRSSFNYSIDPDINRIKKAKFSLSQVVGLLDKYGIEIDRAG